MLITGTRRDEGKRDDAQREGSHDGATNWGEWALGARRGAREDIEWPVGPIPARGDGASTKS